MLPHSVRFSHGMRYCMNRKSRAKYSMQVAGLEGGCNLCWSRETDRRSEQSENRVNCSLGVACNSIAEMLNSMRRLRKWR